MLVIEDLSKTIKNSIILKNISLQLHSGRIYGLKGKNGSGKTMLMRAICGLISPTEGKIIINDEILGQDISFPRSVGALIENPSFLNNYTGYENLKLIASIKNIIDESMIKKTIQQVGLDPDDKRKYKKYSLGMKQRLGLACVLMEDPELLILDEPINALDESGVDIVRKILFERKSRGSLIIIACHDREELELLADEIFTMSDGKIVDHYVLKSENNEE